MIELAVADEDVVSVGAMEQVAIGHGVDDPRLRGRDREGERQRSDLRSRRVIHADEVCSSPERPHVDDRLSLRQSVSIGIEQIGDHPWPGRRGDLQSRLVK